VGFMTRMETTVGNSDVASFQFVHVTRMRKPR
jgi:hypothetical protein